MSILAWMGLSALAQTSIDVNALLKEMTAAVEEVEAIRDATEEDAVVRCIDERLVPMRSLLEVAERARKASVMAESPGQADLEARKVMVAAIRQEGLLVMARQCAAEEEVVVVSECEDCPDENPTEEGEKGLEVTPGPDDGMLEPDGSSPFE